VPFTSPMSKAKSAAEPITAAAAAAKIFYIKNSL
jgi:hypothetical protein